MPEAQSHHGLTLEYDQVKRWDLINVQLTMYLQLCFFSQTHMKLIFHEVKIMKQKQYWIL